ncbi:MerR family transcriptional regulator [Cellulomonas edaphi]|uniref:MerR family transcriptional regulator n=1 Tax=Cellulomonas edaphi TaxID=3053468 RepID=A0ABT7SCJ5_9CELL|nr:MerR family transcriptional regulator [Cellulomons edaphi]MDM7832669.1 MerR family transcriptional regulator [Cellulomons edaphi]
MEASIQEIARLTGTTSRTLRHYDAIGLLAPSRVGDNGYRWYDEAALVRLQRILLLRDLGLGLAEIGLALDQESDDTAALRRHLAGLATEKQRLDRQIAAVERTISSREQGGTIMAESMFDGFDHTRHEDEVIARWGRTAYDTSDAWWRGMSADERTRWKAQTAALAQEWADAAGAGHDPASDFAQDLAKRHVAWLGSVPGTPGHGSEPVAAYVSGLADMYVTDPRFSASYGGEQGARFVRDALHLYAARHL